SRRSDQLGSLLRGQRLASQLVDTVDERMDQPTHGVEVSSVHVLQCVLKRVEETIGAIAWHSPVGDQGVYVFDEVFQRLYRCLRRRGSNDGDREYRHIT